jgi:hypothetical protein
MDDTWLLGRFERNLADIRRWSIVRTTREQSVVEHSFYVALMVPRLLRQYGFEDPQMLLDATQYALRHDMSEVLTGDIATPIKKRLPEGAFTMMEMEFGFPPEEIDPIVQQAVKVIDLFEAAAFLAEEIAIGNSRVVDVQRVIKYKLEKACVAFEKAVGKSDGLYRVMSTVLYHLQYSMVDPLEPDLS